MIRVKNNGVAQVQTGGSPFNPVKSNVKTAVVKPTYLGKGQASFEILYTGPNPDGEGEDVKYGYYPSDVFECGPFEADAEDVNLSALCYAEAIRVLGPQWEIAPDSE